MKKTNQTGYTLIEVLVAAALGILLLGIVITIYLGSKSTFRAAEGLGRSQETTRFALHFLKQDIRTAGFLGCAEGASRRNLMNDLADSFPFSENNAVFGWEFANTDVGNAYDLDYTEVDAQFTQAEVAAARTGNTIGPASWQGRYIEESANQLRDKNLPAVIARGSDILAVSSTVPWSEFSPGSPDIFIGLQANQGSPTLNVTDFLGNAIESQVPTGTVLKIADCSAVDTFQNEAQATDQFLSALPGGNEPGNRLTGAFRWQKKWSDDAALYVSTTKIYFVGTGAGGKPSLFVYETSCGIGGDCALVSELVEGVENMQILYGEDTRRGRGLPTQVDEFQFDGVVDDYRSGDDVEDFRNVMNVKIGLLVRSPDIGVDQANDPTFQLLDQIEITPPNDRRQRFVSNATIRLHNRGL